ncbi:MAG TPA: AAA family ATPase [Fimbriimonadaceae bacterium]|nr:AAA family ATPase [Fimbriimonadaceae bacterium]
MPRPLLVVVTGRPGAGKSTLALALSEVLRLPLVSRDVFKENLVRSQSEEIPQRDLNLAATDAFFEAIERPLVRGTSLVAEAAFQHSVWCSRLQPFLPTADVRIVVCQVPAALAWERVQERMSRDPEWSRYHPISTVHRGADEPYDPPRLLQVPTLEIDTSEELPAPLALALAFLS